MLLHRPLVFAAIVGWATAFTVNNIDSLRKQIARNEVPYGSQIDDILMQLTPEESDFMTFHLQELQNYNGTECEQCHNKIKYGQQLIQNDPSKQRLISLMMYQYCLLQNKNKDSKCENVDFFITTNSANTHHQKDEATGPGGGFEGATSINFFDNDFSAMLRNFNVSSELSLNYYCHFKGKYCKMPKTPDVSTLFDLESMWPEKDPKYSQEPEYNTTGEYFNVLHISDFHNQLRFEVGSEANCSQGLCCLPELYNSDLTDPDYNFTSVYTAVGAGDDLRLAFFPEARYTSNETLDLGHYYDFPKYRGWSWAWEPATAFGNYQCDPPEVMLNSSLRHISSTSNENKYEFAIFTGDIVDHDEAHCDANVTKYAELRLYGIMKHYFDGLPIYPTMGNHDTFPYGQMAPQRLGAELINSSVYHWNDEMLAELWTSYGWVDSDNKEFLRQHYSGFATVTKRGLKVISLNSNAYYKKNLWAFINMETEPDLFGQWEWLISELVESESNNQRVWIMAHIPSGDTSTLPIQLEIFARIVARFSPYTIANIFYGHTHRDQLKVLYDDDQNPINMAWISQAITPLGPANPSWRYYEIEDGSFNVINVHNYYTPLNETWVNGAAEPVWKYEYSARESYDPEGEWPAEAPLNATFWDKYVVQKLKDRTAVDFNQKYTDYLYRINPYVPDCSNGTSVSDDCYTDNYCDAMGFRVDDYYKCTE